MRRTTSAGWRRSEHVREWLTGNETPDPLLDLLQVRLDQMLLADRPRDQTRDRKSARDDPT